MNFASSVGLLVTAGVLGITHGIEPDHLAGITALTHEAGDPKLSALVGSCFATGHALLVVLWIALAFVLFGTTSIPGIYEQFGLLLVGIILSLLSLYLGITGVRKLLHQHRHRHRDRPHTHVHIHLPSVITSKDSHDDRSHEHGILEYLKIGTVGALFTLSPPVSMIAFISVAMSQSGETLMVGVVSMYTISIIITMAAIGGGAGSLFRFSRTKGERFHAISKIVASILVLALAINLLSGVISGFAPVVT